MKRTHKKSIIVLTTCEQLPILFNENYVLQIEPVEDRRLIVDNLNTLQVKPVENTIFIVEFLNSKDAEEYINSSATETPAKNTLDMEYENALTTVLNNDPQGKYSGRTLEEIFNDPNGAQWVDWALKNMHNKFILDRVKIIYNKRGAK